MCRRNHTLADPPADLSKKITLLKHFRGYMQENLTKAYVDQGVESVATTGLDFLTKYLRTKTGVIFRLSNHSIQVCARRLPQLNLFDHTKLVVADYGKSITFIDQHRQMETRPLEWWLGNSHSDVIDRLVYCRDIVEQMLLKTKVAA
ncbi:Serine/threonine-protein kinase plk1 [Kappamyces sp. JEL0680]|nr:Serine/threonine-protein kinase plk1 [Kappamyces sp. JEL0680]